MSATFVYVGPDQVWSCGCIFLNYGVSAPTRHVPCERHTPYGKEGQRDDGWYPR